MIHEYGSQTNDLQLTTTQEKMNAKWFAKVHVVVVSVNLILRLTASLAAAAYNGWLPRQRKLVQKLKTLLEISFVFSNLPNRLHFFSFTSISYHQINFDFIHQILSKSIINRRPTENCFPGQFDGKEPIIQDLEPEPSVHIDVLYDPTPNPIIADVIFIHGLHGSLGNTWKQGLWGYRKQVRNLPLKHKYGVEEARENTCETEGRPLKGEKRERCVSVGANDPEYDQLLESITDLLNNIDDALKKEFEAEQDEEEPYSPCWPRDWLPKDIPGLRVLAINYTTDPFLWRPVWISKRIRSNLTQRSLEMEELLLQLDVGTHPIIWVGHSKGGLYVKQMLVDGRQSGNPQLRKFLRQTKGIMFYSVPHRGSALASVNVPFLRKSVELLEVKKDCHDVLELHRKFLKLFQDKCLSAEVFSFVETILTFMFVTNVRIVTVDSADLGIGSFRGVNIDHREICKPLNRECFLYTELVNLIRRALSDIH